MKNRYKLSKQSIFEFAAPRVSELNDRYDFETIKNSNVARFIKKFDLIDQAYYFGIMKPSMWPENVRMLCEAANDLKKDYIFNELFNTLQSCRCQSGGWGLPVGWHSGNYYFPAGTMMSTTTAEIANCLYSWQLENGKGPLLSKIFNESLFALKRNLRESYANEDMLILSYTPMDDYRIINSNLLVAAAFSKDSENRFSNEVSKILNGVRKVVKTPGEFTYFYDGGNVDAYHQSFCIKALLELGKDYLLAQEMAEEGLAFLCKHMIDDMGHVFICPDNPLMDLHGVADVLSVFKIIGDDVNYNKVFNCCMDLLYRHDRLYQYAQPDAMGKYKVFTPAFGRQGYLRMMLVL